MLANRGLLPLRVRVVFRTAFLCVAAAWSWSLFISNVARASEGITTVLVVYSERGDWNADELVDRGIRSAFAKEPAGRVDIFNEYIGPWELVSLKDHEQALVHLLGRKYQGRRVDLIVGVAEESLSFLRAHGAELFPGAPIVALGGQSVVRGSGNGPPMTGVTGRLHFKGTVELISRLQPTLSKLTVVSGTSPSDRRLEALARAELRQYSDQMTINYLSGLALADLQNQLAKEPRNAAILLLTVSQDGTGRAHLPDAVVRDLVQVANAPMYGIALSYVGKGIVGGVVFDQETKGREAGGLALRILRGERVQDIPVYEGNSNLKMVDWRQLQRWGIRESLLPPGTIVQFREFSPWIQYRPYILGAFLFLLVETALVAILLVARRRAKRAQALLERRFGIERIISECSTKLSECPAEQVDAETERSLEAILQSEGADRASWIVFDESGSSRQHICTAHRSNLKAEPEFFERLESPWLSQRVREGAPIAFTRLDNLPPEAGAERLYFQERCVKSAAFVPSGPAVGERGLLVLVCLANEREWPHTLTTRLGVLGNIFASALMRKQAQEAKRDSEKRFRYLFTAAPIGIAFEDLDGRLLFANPALCSMLGYTMEEMTDMTWAQFADADKEEDRKHFQAMKDSITQDYQLEKYWTRKDGSRIWVRLNVSLSKGCGRSPLVLATVEDITEKKAAMDDLRRAHAELRKLTSQLIDSQEAERRRIAIDLHDSVGQGLMIIKNRALICLRNPNDRERVREQLEELLATATATIEETRQISRNLRPYELGRLGLIHAVEAMLDNISRSTSLRLSSDLEAIDGLLSPDAQSGVYRIVQEGLNNVLKHASATEARVVIKRAGTQLIVTVTDNGKGKDTLAGKEGRNGTGFGLAGIAHRARMLGGTYDFQSVPEGGSVLRVTAEISEAANE